MRKLPALSILVAACSDPVSGEKPIVVDPETQKVAIDPAQVPVLATCNAGQFVRRAAAGWECADGEWPGTVPADRVTSLDWDQLRPTVATQDPWPGTIPADRVTDLDWSLLESTVGSNDLFPGQCDWSRVINVSGIWPGTLPAPGASSLGGVKTLTCAGNQKLAGINATGTPICAADAAQPLSNVPRVNQVKTLDAETVSEFNAVAIGDDLLPIVVYQVQTTPPKLKVAKCGDAACSAPTIHTLESGAGEWASVAMNHAGLPIVSYRSGTNVKFVRCLDSSCNPSTNTTRTIASVSALSVGTAISVFGSTGVPLIAYHDASKGLQVAQCTNFDCDGATVYTLPGGGNTGLNPSMAVAHNGAQYIASYDADNGELDFLYCAGNGCSSPQAHVVDGLSDDAGELSSMTTGNDGLAIIAYTARVPGNAVKVAHCLDTACASATVTQISTVLNDVFPPSITFGGDGLPMVVFLRSHTPPTSLLRIAKCADLGCTKSAQADVAQNAGGTYPSITTGWDGLPVIAFGNIIANRLHLLKCSNSMCRNYWWRR